MTGRHGRSGLYYLRWACDAWRDARATGDHRAALESLLADLARRTSFLANKLKMVQFETLRERLAHYLLEELAVTGSDTVRLWVSKKELAEIMGVARQSLFRTITELEDARIIACDGREIRVLRPDSLEAVE